MASGETRPSVEFATPDDLERLFDSAAVWLDADGFYFFDPGAVVPGEQERGVLPVAHASQMQTYTLDGQILGHVAPKATETLTIGSGLELTYQYGYYAPDTGGKLLYEHPVLSFVITRDQTDPGTRETIDIWPDINIADGSIRWRTVRIWDPLEGQTADETSAQAIRMIDERYLAGSFDASLLDAIADLIERSSQRLSSVEVGALQEIVDKLDVIKAGQE